MFEGEKTLAVALSFLLLSLIPAGAVGAEDAGEKTPTEIQWQTYAAGLERARTVGKPVLLAFTADWCFYCKKMKRETYPVPAVRDYVNEKYVPVLVDTMQDRETAARYYVRSIPVIWFLTSEGEKITSLPGFVDAPTFLNVLSYIATDAYQSVDFPTYVESHSGQGGEP